MSSVMSRVDLLVALVLAGSAAMLATGWSPVRRPSSGGVGSLATGGRLWSGLVLGGAGCVVAVGAEILDMHGLAVLVGALVLAGWVMSQRTRMSRRNAAADRRLAVVHACEALRGELSAGQPLVRALERTADSWPLLAPAARAARLGGDVPAMLRTSGTAPGAEGLGRLADAWTICSTTGGGLAFAVGRVLDTVRSEQAVLTQVHAELAGARATARMVGALPVLVLLAAQGVDARPWDFLLGTTAGVVCLLAGTALVMAGISWIERIADASAPASSP